MDTPTTHPMRGNRSASTRSASSRSTDRMSGRAKMRGLTLLAGASALALGLAGCAGSAGGAAGGGEGGAGEGFAYDAPQEDVDALLADLEPITVTFQPSAASQNSVMAPAGTVFKELVEERSGGKITVELVWGQAIAGYAEVHDALADGRLDMAYTLPIYFPQEYPAVDAIGTALAGTPASPLVGELVTNALGGELGWNNEQLLSQYDEKGLQPLTPLAASGGYYTVCTDPVTTAADWQGTQVRIASTAQAAQVTHLAGTPVSMEYTETFEALQRGTVDCTLGQLVPSAEAGLFEVAPHLGYTTTHSFSRSPGAYLAGKSWWDSLPLPYQQILFDANALGSSGGMEAVIGGNVDAVKQAKEYGGTVQAFDEDVQAQVGAYSEELVASTVESGQVPEDIADQVAEGVERWTQTFTELGYSDGGDTATLDEWYDPSTDYMPYAKASYENGGLAHRPE